VTDQTQPAPGAAAARITVGGQDYMADARGSLVPVGMIRPQHLLEDEVVRKIMHFGAELSAQVARFKAHVFEDLGDFEALLAQEYGATRGGAKGNREFQSFDGCLKVQVQVADTIVFGPELQVAKGLVDECLTEWAAEARDELRDIVTRAFNTDRASQINRSEVFMLLRLDIRDPRWLRAMAAIRDAMRVIGSKIYVRLYRRAGPAAAWEPVTIDLARA